MRKSLQIIDNGEILILCRPDERAQTSTKCSESALLKLFEKKTKEENNGFLESRWNFCGPKKCLAYQLPSRLLLNLMSVTPSNAIFSVGAILIVIYFELFFNDKIILLISRNLLLYKNRLLKINIELLNKDF